MKTFLLLCSITLTSAACFSQVKSTQIDGGPTRQYTPPVVNTYRPPLKTTPAIDVNPKSTRINSIQTQVSILPSNSGSNSTAFSNNLISLQSGLMQLAEAAANKIKSDFNKISFANPFTNGAAQPDRYSNEQLKNQLTNPGMLKSFDQLAKEREDALKTNDPYTGFLDRKSLFTTPRSLQPLTTKYDDFADEASKYVKFKPLFDRVTNQVISDLPMITPDMGSELKSIKKIGESTIKLFNAGWDEFWACTDNCGDKFNDAWRNYHREVAGALVESVLPVRKFLKLFGPY